MVLLVMLLVLLWESQPHCLPLVLHFIPILLVLSTSSVALQIQPLVLPIPQLPIPQLALQIQPLVLTALQIPPLVLPALFNQLSCFLEVRPEIYLEPALL